MTIQGTRRTLHLPVFPRRRDRRAPDIAAREQAKRSALKRTAAMVIRAFLGSSSSGAVVGGIAVTETARLWLGRRAGAMTACSEVRAFREAQCGQYAVVPVSCKCRVCPDCERARAGRVVRIVSAILDQVPARRRSFVVLTIRNMHELAAGLERIMRALSSLRRRPLFRGGRCRWRTRDGKPGHPCAAITCTRWIAGRHRADRNCPDFKHDAVTGGGAFHEVTVDRVDGRASWHPHVNLLLDAPYIVQAELADTWRAITCDDPRHRRAGWCPTECTSGSPVVWIQKVDPGSVREAVKYVTKSAALIEGDDPDVLIEFMLATRGRRMVQGFGSFFGLEIVEDELPGDTVTVAMETGDHDDSGRPITIRFKLPRICQHCSRDTSMPDGSSTYENPTYVARDDVVLRAGFLTWRPPPRAPA